MSTKPHRHFHDELARLKETVLLMSGRAEDALTRAVDAFMTGDVAAAEEVVREDREIDQLEVDIEEFVTSLLALHQPVAGDLRLVLASLKISNDLERVADHAVNIAKSARRMARRGALPSEPRLVEMARVGREMLAEALGAFVRGDPLAARDVCVRDDQVDSLHRSLLEMMVSQMMDQPESTSVAMEILLVSRNLERIADMATNVAEDVVFLVEGTTIKHGAETRG